MDNADPISKEIEFSGPLDFAAGAPIIDDKVTALLDSYLETSARLKVCIVTGDGSKRTTLKPTIVKFGDATLSDVADACQAIAWYHCSVAGVRGRYCVEAYPRGENGGVGKRPIRAYFDLSPDADAPDVEGDPDKPSPSYVRELERTNERTLRILQDSARAVMRRDEQYHRDRIHTAHIEGASKVEIARIEAAKVDAASRAGRKDVMVNAATSLLPRAFTAALDHLGAAGGTPDEKLPPGKRIEAYLDEKELKIFVGVLGEDRWKKMLATENIQACRDVLGDTGAEDAAKMVGLGLSSAKLTEIASWTDDSVKAAEAGEAAPVEGQVAS